MIRRALDMERDYPTLLAMQRLSWEINFPRLDFSGSAFRRSLESGARHDEIYVYEAEGEIVAWLWLDVAAPGRNGHIRHIQVAQSYWGMQVGRQLIDDAVAVCLERGCRSLTLNVTKANERAMSLYQSVGFVVVEDNGERQRMRLALTSYSSSANSTATE
ncbi:MAG: GNAT family N-acetyltransferase [Chloroflexi bacterium]|nr:GNAT family N-acetyltransferase [Chloroflexota bacterium]